ncbi:palmitoyltransferase for Vac8p [Lobosporangium transversale]|uniref:Palmitoyltransferase n=1 Tax=Lobosporangium transversale TaxID=64571 RepID=A0A1Y2GWD4_9FUNG|nr:DHHC palmitoyltransferase-domain-containing protein [Lobosporangium transversale]KAF9906942.1 palmitoyltransferase for Vac8p [Lobosporangium transversale]ORZ23744.1 DHHC palmitoyltransferase-domain-containing protein [Lobosporangium transversale]|eukprot:XP_021883558.1 DHHC palmitoyltransferase-domain-containing protein [Lobosporangium transversale]
MTVQNYIILSLCKRLIGLGLVGWSYYVFAFSVCGYLLNHGHTFQGVAFLVMVTVIVVLLIWSYCIATFTSPGYPNEILQKYSGYHSAIQGDISMVDHEDTVRVGLLEPEQFYLSSSLNAHSSPLPDTRAIAATSTTTGANIRDRDVGRVPTSSMGHVERLSEETDGMNQSHTCQAAQFTAIAESSGSGTGVVQYNCHVSSSILVPPPPPLQSAQGLTQDHTVVQMVGARSNVRHDGYEGDSEDTADNMPLGRSIRRFTVKRDGKMRYCQKCHFEKPDRTHHCSSCKRCVLKMDHHCPWLNNCVGHRNYKAFFLFVLWTAIYCVTLVACTIPVAAGVASLPNDENAFDPQWVFMILIGMIFGLCLVPFAIHHLLLIKSNRTTIESFEKHRYRVGNTGEVMQSRVLNVFDLGRKKNFIQVLGPTWYLWLVPVRNSIGDGWSFPANDYGKSVLYQGDNDTNIRNSQNRWMQNDASPAKPYYHNTHGPYDGVGNSGYESYDMNDTSDLDQEHYRRDSDESDEDGRRGRRYPQPPPRRLRQQHGAFATVQHDSDEEAEEYLYDSDEPATIRFTDTER